MKSLEIEKHIQNYNRILISILLSNHFFRPNTISDKFKVINDYQKADTLYTMEYPLEELGKEEGEKYDIYVDLMNDRTLMGFQYYAELTEEEYDYFNKISNEFSETIWRIILDLQKSNKYIPDRFTDYIFNDFVAISAYLSFCPRLDELMELKIEAYVNGAMPCGWYGKYPEGKLAVYVPNLQSGS